MVLVLVMVSAKSIGRKFRTIWVSVSVLDLNQNSGFSHSLVLGGVHLNTPPLNTTSLHRFHYFILLHKSLIALMDETHAVLLLFFKAGDKCFFGHKSKPLFQWSFKGGSTVVFKGVKREFWFIQTTPASSTGSLHYSKQKMQVWFIRILSKKEKEFIKQTFLWICSALQAVLSFSAWEKSCDSTRNSRKLEDAPSSKRRDLHFTSKKLSIVILFSFFEDGTKFKIPSEIKTPFIMSKTFKFWSL